ncbi:MAG TPA: hypothetical protein EYG38_17150, partial [Verrucomicrobia bacterium]|nr:hypothetical protein [Verrucomicrobiota bacterium]
MDGLKTIEVVGKTEGPHLLITAGVHGDEFEGIEALHRLKGFILPEKICGSVTIVPVVNESAFALRNRCGADGLDLARTCPGKHDGSVTQRAAAALVQLIVTADLYMDLHSGGVAMEVYPLAGYMLVESNSVIEKQRRMAHAFGLPLIWGTYSKLEGRSLSVARDARVPAIYVEYLGGGRCHPAGV